MQLRKQFIIITVATALAGLASQASADPHFNNQDVRGDYGFSFDGSLFNVPITATGQFTADGRGNVVAGYRVLNYNGAVVTQTFTCTYAVNANGTWAGSCTIMPGSSTESFAGVIADSDRTLYYIATIPGAAIRATATRQ